MIDIKITGVWLQGDLPRGGYFAHYRPGGPVMAQTPCNNPPGHPVICSPLLQVCHLVSWMLGPIYWALGGPTKYKLLRPPLSKKSFPVGRVGGGGKCQSGGRDFFFFFPNFNFF